MLGCPPTRDCFSTRAVEDWRLSIYSELKLDSGEEAKLNESGSVPCTRETAGDFKAPCLRISQTNLRKEKLNRIVIKEKLNRIVKGKK